MATQPSVVGSDQQNYNLIIRPATENDSSAIREVARFTWEATYSHSVLASNRARVIATSYSDESLRRSFRHYWFRVAEQAGKVIGFGEVILRQGAVLQTGAELTRIYVLPDWQGQGVGQQLLNALLADLHSLEPHLRPPRLFLAVAADNYKAIAFYKARGFRHNRDFQANLPGQLLDMQEYLIEFS